MGAPAHIRRDSSPSSGDAGWLHDFPSAGLSRQFGCRTNRSVRGARCLIRHCKRSIRSSSLSDLFARQHIYPSLHCQFLSAGRLNGRDRKPSVNIDVYGDVDWSRGRAMAVFLVSSY